MSRAQSVRTLVTCLAGSLIAVLAVPVPAMADPPTLLISLGVRETDQDGQIGDFMPLQSGQLEWFDLDSQSLALDGTWQFFSFDLGNVQITAWPGMGDGLISADRGTLDHIRFRSTGFGGPFTVWIDDVADLYVPAGGGAVDLLISSFNDDGTGSPFPDGAEVMFQEPRYSGSTVQYLALGGSSGIDNAVGHDLDTHSVKVHWAFVDDDPNCWLRLGTWNALAQPCPLIAEPGGPAEDYEDSTISFYLKGIPDCNGNGMPDDQDIAGGTSEDCNANGEPDECDIAAGTSEDCNLNGVPDECDIAAGTSEDCTGNGIPDECELDCNANGIGDSCDIAAGTSADCQPNGIPDECDFLVELFSDDFDTDTSSDWDLFDHAGDYTAEFAFDYSGHGIPPAPNSTGGSTLGLKLTVNNNDAIAATDAVSLFPIGGSFDGIHSLKFDMWMNYAGGAGGSGGIGSTEFATAGINHTATRVNWAENPDSDGFWFAVTGEGGAVQDYRAYREATLLLPPEGGYVADDLDHSNAFYQALFPSPPYETQGAPGKHWVEVEISQAGNTIGWRLNDTLVATRVDTTVTSGNVMLGYMDIYTSIADPVDDNFVIYDNVRVVTGGTSFDCNGNDVPDECDIDGGTSEDCNANGVPDECEAIIVYVDDSATGLNDGTSWADAYVDLQDALAAAGTGCPPIAEIWVAAGTYKPDGASPGDRTLRFELVDGVAVYGGFAGGETDLTQRDASANPTILSGDIGTEDDYSDNTYHVVLAYNIYSDDSNAILDGFTVTGGYGSDGSGMQITDASVTVANCTFASNYASSGYGGGGLYIIQTLLGNPTVANCTFWGNSADYGGGMYITGGAPTVVNCTFSQNYSFEEGGGMYIQSGSPTVDNCIFWHPSEWPQAEIVDDGGMLVVSYSDVQGGWAGEGNIDLDPMFVDAPNGDLRLLPGSPCIDAASNLALPTDVADLDGDGDTSEPVPFDLDGNPRRLDDPDTPDTGYGTFPIVDMGAYEFAEGDCNGNGVPDLQDIEDGTSDDCNINYIPDECEPNEDCNNNGIQDICDIGAGTSDDCNLNWVPDECEPDFDGDGTIDVCDDDIDADGVPNDDDACNFTPPGAPIVTDPQDPLYGTLRSDSDGDCDVDLEDYALMQQEFTGPGQ